MVDAKETETLKRFSSITVPTDFRDVSLFFNSVALGYHAYRCQDPDARLKGIIPSVELHLNTPLNHRGLSDNAPIAFSDNLNVTAGASFVFCRATVAAAFGLPLTGPNPWDFEALVSLNLRF